MNEHLYIETGVV